MARRSSPNAMMDSVSCSGSVEPGQVGLRVVPQVVGVDTTGVDRPVVPVLTAVVGAGPGVLGVERLTLQGLVRLLLLSLTLGGLLLGELVLLLDVAGLIHGGIMGGLAEVAQLFPGLVGGTLFLADLRHGGGIPS